ncbi:aspartate aminotransferase family protein [Naasia lichenicola]|uniref:Aspartate aminotransferase family protein n=2 Tax=Naasia lichenicola TaxID=2565933 RepID=A0A4S4FGF1_9MICO|nr:aspartate aminotransferase family protein [Naasia lichenicola]THG28784.1 aspartate aminotransferase family protein [Naasia lichenicola]
MDSTGLSGDSESRPSADAILARLSELRAGDAPTHGGHVLSYVYDSGLAELDELAGAAIAAMQPVNGLDPTTFGSVAVLEREVIDFMRDLLGAGPTADAADDQGDREVVGSVTTGGTESCLLAVKTARDLWRLGGGSGTPRLVAPVTVHAAFQKAAHYFGLDLDLVPVDPATGSCEPSAIIGRLGADVALVVISAPSYPFAALDPVEQVAAAAADAGISCHVDACIGGLALPFLPDLPPWDFRVRGVTSISADLHKYGYAPKGASVLLHRGRGRLGAQYFATTRWPGYPVVNPTMLGSRSAGPLAAAWAILHRLGRDGLARLAEDTMASTRELLAVVERIDGLRVIGSPVGPLFAVASDPRADQGRQVDPHHWADELRALGWLVQLQPSLRQGEEILPHTTHLTVTPVTSRILPELSAAMVLAADRVRGIPAVDPLAAMAALGGDPAAVVDGPLPERMAPLIALIGALPAETSEGLLTELLARLANPTRPSADPVLPGQ